MSLGNIWSRLTGYFKKFSKTTPSYVAGTQNEDKPVYFKIPLYRFHFMHEPNRTSSDGEYIGRDKIKDNLLSVLNDGRGKSGTYLISGYRGSGKTSFVKTTLYDYQYGVAFYKKLSLVNATSSFFKASIGSLKMLWIKYYSLMRFVKITIIFFLIVGLAYFSMEGKWHTVVFLLLANFILWGSIKISELPLIGLLVFLMYCPPLFDNLVYNFLWLGIVIVIFLFLSKVFRDGIARAFNFKKNIIYGFFRPVIRVNINLGHESLDAKTLLFNMSSLLRSRCKEVKSKIFYLLFIGIVFYISAYVTKLSSDAVSKNINGYIFDVYYVDETLINVIGKEEKEMKKEINDSLIKLKSCVKDKVSSEDRNNCDYIYKDVYENIYLDSDSARNKILESNEGLKLSEYDFKIFNRQVNYLLENSKVSNHFVSVKEVDVICSKVTVKNEGHENIKDSSGFVHKTYCLLNSFNKKINDIVNIKQTNQASDSRPLEWLYLRYANFIKWFQIGTFELFCYSSDISDYKCSGTNGSDHYAPPQNFIFAFIFVIIFIVSYTIYRLTGFNRFIRKLDYINERVIYSTSTESNTSPLPWVQSLLFKKTKVTERLDTRQIEELLLDALEYNRSIFQFMPQADIIFIFDELDKITPQTQENRFTGSQIDEARQRKRQIEALLGSLKNFITIAPARFIFIGGRDMYDTNLIEQISPNRIHGSMFDAIIYVPSFLTDDSDGVGEDISSMIEQYVCRRLFPSAIAYSLFKKKEKRLPENAYEIWSLNIYREFLCEALGIDEHHADEIIKFLQKFIYYLTYRSAGCVQRLSYHFERFFETDNTMINSLFEYEKLPDPKLPTKFYLGFDERQQYKIEIIANLFIILHAEANQLVRQFGDKLMLSTFSLLDYIFKYHNIGFNSLDIERAPEMLDIYRTPSLPGLIDYFLNHVLKPYLRPIKNGLFEYRFIHSFQAEIAYISYFSEQEMAAFNFSLDESINTKQHFDTLLKKAKSETPEYLRQIDRSMLLESDVPVALPFIHQSLGDLYFLDKQYPEALMEYRLALQYLTQAIDEFQLPFEDIKKGRENNYNPYPLKNYVFLVIAYLRILLKMILASEIRKQYDYTIALCSQAERTVQHFMKGHLGKRFFMPNIAILPLIIQPYLCLAFIHLKKNPNSTSSIHIIEGIINRVEENLKKANRNSGQKKFKTEKNNVEEIKSYIYTKAGDLCLTLSKFDDKYYSKDNAKYFYDQALNALPKKDRSSGDLAEIGYILMSLGNVKIISLEEKVMEESDAKLHLESSKAYEDAGRYADAFLVLWSFLFLCVYAKNVKINSGLIELLNKKMSSLDELSFKFGYGLSDNEYSESDNKERIRHESPLLKSTNVLFSYLNAAPDKIKIRGLDGFPVETKILAYYLKAKKFLNLIENVDNTDLCEVFSEFFSKIKNFFASGVEEKNRNESEKIIIKNIGNAIILYIKAIEESVVYIGTQEYVFPHPALMYRDLIKLLDLLESEYKESKDIFSNGLNKNLKKYFNKEYCETQRDVLSKAMINRHKPSEDFYKYVEKKYYLNDSFSDPYLNTLWVADYILSKQFENKFSDPSKEQPTKTH